MKAKVLIILPSDKFLHRQILEGVLSYGHEHGPWQFQFETGDKFRMPWRSSGIIALVRRKDQAEQILRANTPAVMLNPPVSSCPPPQVTFVNRNQEDVGRTAAEHFLERGYRNFAFIGAPTPAEWCERRLAGMRARLRRDGFDCEVFPGAPRKVADDFDRESPYVAKWLKSLQPKTALYVTWDRRALQIIGLCRELGISVPGTIAILGTDNDEVLCESSTPSLSSIALDGRNAGQLCAQLLDGHMRRRKVEPIVDLAFPRVVTRQSSDETLIPDRFLARALSIIRRDLSERHTIAAIADEIGISKRTLEMKANLVLGTTLKCEITRIRLNEAVRLISNTDLSIQSIAERCGFCCAGHLNARFKAVFGHTPSVFRYQNPK